MDGGWGMERGKCRMVNGEKWVLGEEGEQEAPNKADGRTLQLLGAGAPPP